MPTLFIYPDKEAPFSFEMPEAKIVIGRSPKNEVVLKDPCCSSFHASISPGPGGYILKDMESKNGTFLNGRRISGEAEIKRGDEIQIGDARIVFDRETFRRSSQTIIQVRDIIDKPSQEKSLIDEANMALSTDRPLGEFLDHIMNVVTRYIRMDRGILMLKEEGSGKLERKVVKVPGRSTQVEALPVSWSIIHRALDQNDAVLISDVQADETIKAAQSVILHQIHSALCVPLWNNKVVMGVIYADRISVSGPFGESDLRALTFLAHVAAGRLTEVQLRDAEIRNEKYQEELEWAQRTQQNLLPKEDPAFEPFDISGRARTCQHVGGDYFDFIDLGPGRLGVVVADVSGTGMGAAILMANLNGALLSGIRLTDDLAELAARLNDDIHTKSEINAFISCFLAVVDRKRGEMTYVNAGHNPPFLMSSSGDIESLHSTGLCLGMFPSMTYEKRTVPLAAGDLLCLYTDGVVESRNEKREEFGDERLLAVLKQATPLPAREIVEKVYEAVFAFTGNPKPEDDITVVILKR